MLLDLYFLSYVIVSLTRNRRGGDLEQVGADLKMIRPTISSSYTILVLRSPLTSPQDRI